jgi:AAA family ATP:ADP antiporter
MKVFEVLRKSDPQYRKNFFFFLGAYFFVQLNYPLVRASSTTFFFEAFGAKSTPGAILASVIALTLSILMFNKLQTKRSVQLVFFIASFFSFLFFGATTSGYLSGWKDLATAIFIWKEIYIVVQIHVLLAWANNYLRREDFKILLGPLGAVGSLGAIIGGLMTSFISEHMGTSTVMWTGIVFVFLPSLFFIFTSSVKVAEKKETKVSPLASLRDEKVGRYVLIIAVIVALTQFIINIADFRFHIEFESAITESSARTSYLGRIYTLINIVTLIFQIFLLPYVLPRVSEKNYHLFIPLSYVVCVLSLIFGSSVGLLPVAALYTYFKAADYSLFSGGKEILYQPLGQEQKYGAKYLTDMLVYRGAKAMVAAVLIYLQSSTILNMLMLIFLAIWIVLVIELFKLHKKLF